MPHVLFRAQVDTFRSDKLGETKLTLLIPECDKAAAFEAGSLTGIVLVVTVLPEQEFLAQSASSRPKRKAA